MTEAEMEQAVRKVLADQGKLSADAGAVDAKASLFDLGMDSQAVIRVMLAIEDELDITFSDDALTRDTFSTIDSILAAVARSQA